MRVLGESVSADIVDIPAAAVHASYLAEVVSVNDPDGLARVQVRLHNFDGVTGHDAPLWARVAVPFAGGSRGAFFLPSVGDEVLVTLLNGDPRFPIVIGGLWNGRDKPPDSLGGDGSAVDRWLFVGRAGTKVAIIEEQSGQPKIVLQTPGGVSATLDDASGGKLELKAANNTITIDTQGVHVQTSGKVTVQASQVDVTAGMVNVDAAMSKFSGVVKCDTLISTSVVSSTYTPGAGNIW